MKSEELTFYRTADAVLTITAEDRDRIIGAAKLNGASTVLEPQRITPLPMVSEAVGLAGLSGGESDQGGDYENENGRLGCPFEQRAGLVMVGNGANPVNRISVEWFLR